MVYDAFKAYSSITVFYNYFVIFQLHVSQHGVMTSVYLSTDVIYNQKLFITMVPDSKALSFHFP